VTPPIVQVPVVTIPRQPETAVAADHASSSGQPAAGGREFDGSAVAGTGELDASRSGQPAVDGGRLEVAERRDATLPARVAGAALKHGNGWLPPIWLLGSAVVLTWSLIRVCRFSRLLAAESEVAPQQLQAAAAKVGRRLKLKTIPTIRTTPARLSPMVWWTGGKVRIVIPTTLLEQMDEKQWQWILAHELAHVRRRDYLVRWIEWAACVCFWWNPVVWWAQRNLRAAEEICCDALVLSCLKPKPRTYANSLLTAVEFLASPAIRPPAMASEVNGGGFLERRFRMVVSETPARVNPRWLQACVLLCAVAVLPFGLAVAQDLDAVERRLGEGVAEGELSLKQASAMMDALREFAEHEQREEARQEDVGIEERLEEIGEELKAAVKSGELSEEEAWAEWFEIKENEIVPRLKAAVKEGRMPEAEAWAIWRGIEKAEAGERLKAAVEKGDMSKEEALAKWAEINKEPGDGDDAIEAWIKSIGPRLKAAVDAGKMSEEDAWAKWFEIKEKQIAPKLKAAVKAGRLPEDRAWDIWHGLEKGEAAARLKAAVEKGEMSAEEARAKWAEINKDGDDEE